MPYSTRSRERLSECDERLQRLFEEVDRRGHECTIITGYRGREAQEQAYHDGMSKAHFGESPHNVSPSRAVDAAPYPIDWKDEPRFVAFATDVQQIAAEMNIRIKWGGDFKTIHDLDHFELDEELNDERSTDNKNLDPA